jgi:hypothetical protein
MKDNNFDVPFLWFMSSVLPEVSDSLLFNLSSPINTDLKSPHALRSAKDNLKTDGVFHLAGMAQGGHALLLDRVFDVHHPYWINRKMFFSDHNGTAAFVSACQVYADFGYTNPMLCTRNNVENEPAHDAKYMRHYMASLTRSFRQQQRDLLQQQMRIDNQQIVIEELLQAVRLLNASIVRLDEHSQNV